jgi:hypothetical protein
MFLTRLLLAVTLLLTLSSPALGQLATDIRCLVLSDAFATRSNNEAIKGATQPVAFFYAGKIDGRWADAQLLAEITKQKKLVSSKNAGAEMQACASRMQVSLRRLGTSIAKTKR